MTARPGGALRFRRSDAGMRQALAARFRTSWRSPCRWFACCGADTSPGGAAGDMLLLDRGYRELDRLVFTRKRANHETRPLYGSDCTSVMIRSTFRRGGGPPVDHRPAACRWSRYPAATRA